MTASFSQVPSVCLGGSRVTRNVKPSHISSCIWWSWCHHAYGTYLGTALQREMGCTSTSPVRNPILVGVLLQKTVDLVFSPWIGTTAASQQFCSHFLPLQGQKWSTLLLVLSFKGWHLHLPPEVSNEKFHPLVLFHCSHHNTSPIWDVLPLGAAWSGGMNYSGLYRRVTFWS